MAWIALDWLIYLVTIHSFLPSFIQSVSESVISFPFLGAAHQVSHQFVIPKTARTKVLKVGSG